MKKKLTYLFFIIFIININFISYAKKTKKNKTFPLHEEIRTISHTESNLERITERAKKIIEQKKININEKNNKGETPLYLAVKCNKVEILKYLLEQGADINICNNKGYYPIHKAIKHKNIEICAILLAHSNLQLMVKSSYLLRTALHMAIELPKRQYKAKKITEAKMMTIMNMLLKHKDGKKLIDIQDDAGYTVLNLAILQHLKNIVKLLLDHQASVHIKTLYDRTVLHAAYKHPDVLKLLLKNGAGKLINIPDKDGHTPLYYIVMNKRLSLELQKELIKILHPYGLDSKHKDMFKRTAVYYFQEKAKLVTDVIDDINNLLK